MTRCSTPCGVVERPGESDADAESCRRGRGSRGIRAAAVGRRQRDGPRSPRASSASPPPLTPHASTTASAPAPRSSGARRSATTAPVRSHQHRTSARRGPDARPTACPASGTSRSTVRGLPPGRRPAPGLRRQPLRPQPGGDLADGLRGEPRPLGELEPADARPPRPSAAGRAPAPRCGCAARAGSPPPATAAFRPPSPPHRPLPSRCRSPPHCPPSLALWQQRCLSGGHDWHQHSWTPSASASSATASPAPSSTPR